MEREGEEVILSKRLVDHFGLGEDETVLGTYSCALLSAAAAPTPLSSSLFTFTPSLSSSAHTRRAGWLILFQKAAAFAAHPRSVLLPFKEIVAIYGDNISGRRVARGDSAGQEKVDRESGIRIVLSDRRTFLFSSFQKREEAYSLLSLLWESDMESRIHLADARPQSSLSSPTVPPSVQQSLSVEEAEKKAGEMEARGEWE